MTDPLSRVRAIALLLPETEEAEPGVFLVAGERFAAVLGAELVLADDERVTIGEDSDWASIEDRIARAWELTAPEGLLEAGGR